MSNITVTSVQQYTIDRLRISLHAAFDTNTLQNLNVKLFDSTGTDISNNLKSVIASNAERWEDLSETNVIDIYLSSNTSISAGTYKVQIYDGIQLIFDDMITIEYMEDVRVSFGELVVDSLNSFHIEIIPIESTYQSKKMLEVMDIAIVDESGANYASHFNSLQDILALKSSDEFTDLSLTLKDGMDLPKGTYKVRFTSRYKSRTFAIIEKEYQIPFMTTTPPEIGSAYVSTNANGVTNLTILFKNFLEKSMLNSSTFSVVYDVLDKDVTKYFNAVRISTQSNSTAGVTYITRIDIPLISDLYTLEKGNYTISFKWGLSYVNDVVYKMNVKWFLHEMSELTLNEMHNVTLKFPDMLTYDILKSAKIVLEIDGESAELSDVFDSLSESNTITEDTKTLFLSLNIKDKTKIVSGIYSFILYYTDSSGSIKYEYIGNIDLVEKLTPDISSITQTDCDTFNISLKNSVPIYVLEERCVPHLLDGYINKSYDDCLMSIRNSNVWEAGQTMVDRFDVVISNEAAIPSGNYTFNLTSYGNELKKFSVSVGYMESRDGIIESITQMDLSHIKIKFSKPQTRKLLLASKFSVERKIDGADFTDRFELLENVLKADEYVISELVIPMDHEDSFPSGRYTVAFKYETSNSLIDVYAYDVELGYMTLSLPEISTIVTSKDNSGKLNIKINFGVYLEKSLFDSSYISIINPYNKDVVSDFTYKDSWTLVTSTKKENVYIKSMTIKALTKDIHFERGNYSFKLSWDELTYPIPELSSKVFLEYNLPYTVEQEVSAYDSSNNSARLYFKFDKVLQHSFFENLKVEVLNENGVDHTEYFSTIQDSNPEESGVSTDNINLDIINTEDLSFGVYTIVFYHETEEGRESVYMTKIDIRAALVPSILSLEQVGIDMLLVNLKASVPRMLLESYSFRFESFSFNDITNQFKSIDASNDWDESIRDVSSFYLKLKSGYIVESGSYLLTMYAGTNELESAYIDIERMEGTSFEISNISSINLSTLRIEFSEEQTSALFKTFSLIVETIDGRDVTDSFESLANALKTTNTDLFETLDINITDNNAIAKGTYIFTIARYNNGIRYDLNSFTVNLSYMSNTYPLLYEVSATKTSSGKDALLLWFSPALELNLYENAEFSFTNISGLDMRYKFVDIKNAIVDTTIENDITYVNYVTLDFNSNYVLEKGDYNVSFDWKAPYAYMKKLKSDVSLDYILFPISKLELLDIQTVRMTFKEFHTGEYLKKCGLRVDSIYQTTNEDGTIITTTDFSNKFELVIDTLVDSENYDTVDIKLCGNSQIPDGNYRFIVTEYDTVTKTLVYAYAGTINISYMVSKDNIPDDCEMKQVALDKIKISFDKYQNTELFEKCEVKVLNSSSKDYSSYFSGITFTDYKEDDLVIDEIHYRQKIAKEFYLSIGKDKAIPKDIYTISLLFDGKEYISKSISTVFMTTNKTEIQSMCISEDNLVVSFEPYAELSTLVNGSYELKRQSGISETGEFIGVDVTSNFGSIVNGTMNSFDTDGITYVQDISIPINKNAMIASGKYELTFVWDKNSFMGSSTLISGLSIYAKDILSAYTVDYNKLVVNFKEEWSVDYIRSLKFNVINASGNECTDLFKSIEESNKELESGSTASSYYIMADDDIVADTYTFTLSDVTFDEDGTTAYTPVFMFSMGITYLTTEFSVITLVDNLSNEKYEILNLTNANINSYIGKHVQLTTSTEKEILTEENSIDYLGKEVKVYGDVRIDTLTATFNDHVHACLLAACKFTITNSEGTDYSEYFKPISETNTFKYHSVIDYVSIQFPVSKTGEYYGGCDITIQKKDGTDISTLFDSIIETNELDDDVSLSVILLRPSDDNYLDIKEYSNLVIGVTDADDNVVKVTHTTYTKQISTVDRIEFQLEDGCTIIPDVYSINMTYQNEPDIVDAATINAFSYSGTLPFLSSNIGRISSVEQVSLSKLAIIFSEDLPTLVFDNIRVSVLDEDGNTYDELFSSITESNTFDDISSISKLSTPYTLYLELAMGNSLNAGNYTVRFTTDICGNEEESGEEDTMEDSSNDSSGIYVLWEYTTSVSYMVKEIQNTITDVEITDIDTVKVTLENPMDISLISEYALQATCEANEFVYDYSTFKPIAKSNNFGLYVLLSDSRYISYSSNGNSWSRLDTEITTGFNDIIYDESRKRYIVTCANGKILEFSSMTKSGLSVTNTGISKSINCIVKSNNRYIAVCNDGIILIGDISSEGVEWRKASSSTTNTLTTVICMSESSLIAVGYHGTVTVSNDNGETWTNVIATSSNINLMSIIKYEYTNSSSGSDEEDNEAYRTGFYAVGTNGTILYSQSGNSQWEVINVDTKNTLYGIVSHDNKIVVVGESGIVITSEDTNTWITNSTGTSITLRNIDYCDNKYIACGSSGIWLTSNFGNVWTVNKSIYNDGYKNIKYTYSQYENNRKVNYFYMTLADGQSIGTVNFFKGTVEPTLENTPASLWKTDKIKSTHVGDIYTKYSVVDGVTVNDKAYQFRLIRTYNESGIVTNEEYQWVSQDIQSVYTSFSSNYTFEVVDSDGDELLLENKEKVIQPKTGVPITYLTANPGIITDVELCSPDNQDSIEFIYPYIRVNMESGNENAIYYASYTVKDSTGKDYTNYFKSLKQSGYEYGSDLNVNSVIIYGTENSINLPSGEYTFEWNWFATTKISKTFTVKNMKSLIQSISRNGKSNEMVVLFNSGITLPLDFFVEESSTMDLLINKIPTTSNGDSSENYYTSSFMTVSESTNFADSSVCESNNVKKFSLKSSESVSVNTGTYIMKLRNTSIPTETDTDMTISAFKFSIDQELSDSKPSISSVKATVRSDIVESLIDRTSVETHEGTIDPSYSDNLTTSWVVSGDDVLKSHVGDIYTNTETQKTFSFYRLGNGTYNWKMNVSKPYLEITFGNYRPTFESLLKYILRIAFCDYVTNDDNTVSEISLISYISHNIAEWDFDMTTKNDVKYINKIYIPFDETQNFPGCSNATFQISWKSDCVYDTISDTGIKVSPITRDYGVISQVYASKIDTDDSSTPEYGLYVKFSNKQEVSFLKECGFSLTHNTTDDDGNAIIEDVSNVFNTIETSNEDEFESETIIDHIWLKIPEGQYVEPGTYTLEISGFKPDSDLSVDMDDEASRIVSFTHEAYIPYLASEMTEDFTAKFESSKKGYSHPVLTLSFIGTLPNKSDFEDWKLHVTRQKDGKDCSDVFRSYKSTVIGFTYSNDNANLVKSISIPMKKGNALALGTYDVTFTFAKSSVMETIPTTGKYTSFTLAMNIISKFGEVTSASIKDKGKTITVSIKMYDEIKTEALLKKSTIGEVLGIKTYKQLLKKVSLEMVNGGGTHRETYLKSPKYDKTKVTYTIRDNHKINPCNMTFKYSYSSINVVKAKTIEFSGMIRNVVGGALKDKKCYVLLEKHDGTSKRRVYKTYKDAQVRIKKMKKHNKTETSQCATCKKCRKYKVLRTKKVKSPIEKYAFRDGKRVQLFKKMSVWYYKGIVGKKTKCKNIEFVKFNDVTDTKYDRIHCDNYTKKATNYEWSLAIATMATKFPKKGDAIYFVWIKKNEIELARGYKANKKGDKTDKCKNYKKNTIDKHITNYKNKVAACAKCKKKELGMKGSVTINWSNARFPIALKTNAKYKKQIEKLVNALYKSKGMSKCKKAKFSLVKHDNSLCKLSCANTKKTDKSLTSGTRKATMVK